MTSAVRRWVPVALVALALLVGCAEGAPVTATDPAPAGEAGEPTEDTASPGPRSTVAAAAVADLADTLGVDEGSVEVRSEQDVTWRDGSLGCATKGMGYTMALVEGTRIVLSVDGADYEYHAGGGRPPFHCPSPTE